jgi:ribonucleoside-triphosphate reductase
MNKYKCHDCGKEIIIKDKEIQNGVLLKYKQGNKQMGKEKEYDVFKCNECYAKNKSLQSFQPCEVYARIVGYLRPVQQWNEGKKQEFKDRVNYKTQ